MKTSSNQGEAGGLQENRWGQEMSGA